MNILGSWEFPKRSSTSNPDSWKFQIKGTPTMSTPVRILWFIHFDFKKPIKNWGIYKAHQFSVLRTILSSRRTILFLKKTMKKHGVDTTSPHHDLLPSPAHHKLAGQAKSLKFSLQEEAPHHLME